METWGYQNLEAWRRVMALGFRFLRGGDCPAGADTSEAVKCDRFWGYQREAGVYK